MVFWRLGLFVFLVRGNLTPRLRCFALTVWAALAMAGSPAQAGSFSANPVRLVLSGGAASTAITVENQGDEAVLVQAEVLAWSQQGGEDRLVASEDLVVSPPIFRMAPGASQTVRVGLTRRIDPHRELAYRLFLKEVPPAPVAGDSQVRVALRLGLPVFVMPPVKAAPQLGWTLAFEGDGALAITATNTGNAHAQVIDLGLRDGEGNLLFQQRRADYVLPGQARTWPLGNPARSGVRMPSAFVIEANTDAGPLTAQVAAP